MLAFCFFQISTSFAELPMASGHTSEGKNVDKDGVPLSPKCSWHEQIPHIGVIPGEKNIFGEVAGWQRVDNARHSDKETKEFVISRARSYQWCPRNGILSLLMVATLYPHAFSLVGSLPCTDGSFFLYFFYSHIDTQKIRLQGSTHRSAKEYLRFFPSHGFVEGPRLEAYFCGMRDSAVLMLSTLEELFMNFPSLLLQPRVKSIEFSNIFRVFLVEALLHVLKKPRVFFSRPKVEGMGSMAFAASQRC